MKHYDRIYIVYFTGGSDDAPKSNAETLMFKAATLGELGVTKMVGLTEGKSSATYDLSQYKPFSQGKVGVYVVGHGTDTSDSVGNCTAEDMATTFDTLSNYKLSRVTFVSCHAGGNGSTIAPHRFISDFWTHAKHYVDEVAGYTGEVSMAASSYTVKATGALPSDAVRVNGLDGTEWWIKKGSVHKRVSHVHDEGANRRKIFISAANGTTSRSWVNKL
jgi:hypothetical protein